MASKENLQISKYMVSKTGNSPAGVAGFRSGSQGNHPAALSIYKDRCWFYFGVLIFWFVLHQGKMNTEDKAVAKQVGMFLKSLNIILEFSINLSSEFFE